MYLYQFSWSCHLILWIKKLTACSDLLLIFMFLLLNKLLTHHIEIDIKNSIFTKLLLFLPFFLEAVTLCYQKRHENLQTSFEKSATRIYKQVLKSLIHSSFFFSWVFENNKDFFLKKKRERTKQALNFYFLFLTMSLENKE